MSLAVVQGQLLAVSVAALHGGGRAPVDRSYRYQGPSPRIWPCAGGGELVVYWTRGFVAPGHFPQAGVPELGTPAKRFEDHYVRLTRCFSGTTQDGQPRGADDVDVQTASIDDDFDCLWNALQQAVCGDVFTTAGCGQIALVGGVPLPVRGTVAGFTIHLIAATQA